MYCFDSRLFPDSGSGAPQAAFIRKKKAMLCASLFIYSVLSLDFVSDLASSFFEVFFGVSPDGDLWSVA